MTIKELEQAVDMTRSNIRFYEQEGLLSPTRLPNGYRDYSQADADTLEKIKLLRRLGLDLDAIRALQEGTLTLSQALADQLAALAHDRAAMDRAQEVCSHLRQTGTDYADLQPRPWLAELDRAPVPTSERFAPPADAAPPAPGHPWRRYFARSLDLSLYTLPIYAFALRGPIANWDSPLFRLVLSYFAIGLMFLMEPLFLHFWGTTPGKWVFGIRIRDSQGNKLSISEGFARFIALFSHGMGYGIPFYSLYREYKSWKLCKDGEWSPWAYDAGGRYEQMTITGGRARYGAYVLVEGVTLCLLLVLYRFSLLPPNRGALDLEGFVENYNFYVEKLSLFSSLDSRGAYREENYLNDVLSRRAHRWEPILEGERVVGFRYTLDSTGSTFYAGDNIAQEVGLLAYAGALPQLAPFRFDPADFLYAIPAQWDFDVTYNGVHMTQSAHFTADQPPKLEAEELVNYSGKADAQLHLEFTLTQP